MRYLRSVSRFISCNDSEIRKIVTRICYRYHIACIDDVVQEFYKQLIIKKFLTHYNPCHPSGTKISTFLYHIIDNIVKVHVKSNEFRIEKHRLSMDHYDYLHRYENDEDIPALESLNRVKLDYENITYRNEFSDSIDGMNFDLKLFERYLESRNKFYTLAKRRNKKVGTNGLNLLKIFQFMQKGYSNSEIATFFGVSNMFITTLKNEIKQSMIDFGLVWNYRKKRDKRFRQHQV